ncbi:hypothetical protein V2G26_007449 [Clonostachys chloroleuca]
MLGAFTVGMISAKWGRKLCGFITVFLTILGTIVDLVAPNWGVWVLAKVIFGLAIGFMQGNTQTYISELAPLRIRGFMLSLFQLWIIFSSFLSACALEGTSNIEGS